MPVIKFQLDQQSYELLVQVAVREWRPRDASRGSAEKGDSRGEYRGRDAGALRRPGVEGWRGCRVNQNSNAPACARAFNLSTVLETR